MHSKLQTGLILFFGILNTSAIVLQSYFRQRTDITPKDSCLRVDSITSKVACFVRCFDALGSYHVISFNNDQQACLCCEDLSGSDVTSLGWKTYLPDPPCQDGYAAYIAPEFQVCLKFVPVSTVYIKAKEHCEAEGGDLIRIDSTLKYDIFKEMLARHDSGGGIEVWIQAVLVNQEWRFHDGSVVPEVCPRSVTGGAGEDYLRARSADDFKCHDMSAGGKYLYICEYNL